MKKEHIITITVDGESVEIPKKDTAAKDILIAANLDPTQRYLIEIRGSKKISYKENPEEVIKNLHPNQKFLTARLGPVTVSCF